MSDTSTATVRTVVGTAWVAFVVDLVRRVTGIELGPTEVAAAVAALAGIVYRACRAIEARWPKVGYVLFGLAKAPKYEG